MARWGLMVRASLAWLGVKPMSEQLSVCNDMSVMRRMMSTDAVPVTHRLMRSSVPLSSPTLTAPLLIMIFLPPQALTISLAPPIQLRLL